MATTPTETREIIERWKAEHPDLTGSAPAAPAPRRRPPAPSADPHASRAEQQEMIERWRRENPALAAGRPPTPQTAVTRPDRTADPDRRVFDLDSTPLTVLGAFIVGCILGGVAMTIITGIAFWGFASG